MHLLGNITADEQDYLAERIAIMIIDGGLTLEAAEKEACKIVLERRTQGVACVH